MPALDAARPPDPGPRQRAGRRWLADYLCWLDRRARGSRAYRDGARTFLGRWPDPQAFAAEPLAVMLSAPVHQRPFITFLMLHDALRPSYDYLVHRKFASLVELAADSPLRQDLADFEAAAVRVGFSAHTRSRAAERVLIRLLVHTGRSMHELATADLAELEHAFRLRAQVKGGSWANDRGFLHAAWTVLFDLGILPVTAPNRRRRDHADQQHHLGGVPAWMAASIQQYADAIAGTHARSTIDGITIRLAHFARHLHATDPDLHTLAALERTRHIETYLAAVATATTMRDSKPISVGEQRNRVITLGRFLADIAQWGWPDVPARRLLFPRDIPRLPRPLPRYLPAHADRRLAQALNASDHRLAADALLLARATGVRIGELLDLELDCVHEVPNTGAWLKVPLGKLDTERMVPLDEEVLALVDRIAATRSPVHPLPHPRTGRPTDFLLVQHGKRISAQALRDELARAADHADLPHTTPHQLRHTWATALVNAGCSLQALMAMLGHTSAAMSLRYAKLFDATIRADYERALTHAKHHLVPALPERPLLPLAELTRGDPPTGQWTSTPLIKSRLAGGYCLRTAAQGSCQYANICEHCPNFRTDAAFRTVLAAQRSDTEILLADAETRGWGEEAIRHRRLLTRLDTLMEQTQSP
jgi:integrase